MAKPSNLVSDLAILDEIHKVYEPIYLAGLDEEGVLHKTYIPIDIHDIARRLGMNKHILFGRLYYHLDQKYRYKDFDEAETHLFLREIRGQRHCIHFPLLSAAVSERQHEVNRLLVPIVVSITSSVVCSIVMPIVLKLLFK